MSTFKIVTLVIAMSLVGGTAPEVRAADHEFCRDYAESAVRQFHYAERYERCQGYLRADRNKWQDNFKAHYDWCRGVSRDTAWAGRRSRSEAIASCRGRDQFDDFR